MNKEKKKWKPPFTTGLIEEDYSLLEEYLSLAKESNPAAFEQALLKEEDYSLLRSEARESSNALELIEKLSEKLLPRIDPSLAEKAATRLGLPLHGTDAAKAVARLLAAWLIETGDYWGMIKLRRRRSREKRS